jgi:hypothetical protein
VIIGNKLNAYSSETRLAASAILSGLIYLFIFTLPFPLTKLYSTIPPIDYTKLTGYSQNGLWVYVLGIGILFGLYIWAIRLTALISSSFTGPFVFLSSTAFAVILIFSYPLTAIDLFIYAIRTRGWALYGLPPLSTPPEGLPTSDPWLGLAGEWVDAASPYGPLWEWLSLGAFYLSNGSFLGHLFALKVLGMLAYLGCTWLVYQTLQHLRPSWAIAGTIAFAWNPLVLFESVQNAHNDILMTFFLLAAVWVFVQMKPSAWLWPILFCVLLALSILIKFVTVMVGPFLLLALARQQQTWPRRIASLGLYGLITAALVIGPMFLVWPGWDDWAVLQAGRGAGRSLLALLVLGLRDSLGTNRAFDLSRNMILAIFGLIYLYYLWQTFINLRQASSTSLSSDLARDKSSSSPHSPTPLLPRSPAAYETGIYSGFYRWPCF